jgi:hypothetical protein
MTPIGPFTTETEARKAAHQIERPFTGSPILSKEQNSTLLLDVCQDLGVELGHYDVSVIGWLSGWTDANCAVVAGLIQRAFEAGRIAGGEGSES